MNRPSLKAEDLNSDHRLHGLIDGLFTVDRNYWTQTRRIMKAQLRHQELASEDCFVVYLELEELLNARTAWMLGLVARWAFEEGRRYADVRNK